jgi:hypothetical protein
MATERQIQANRLNAKKSTGPKTAAGLMRSSQNRLRHGLSAGALVVGDEDPTELADLQRSYAETFKPQGPLEEQLVLHMTMGAWSIRRAHRIEANSFPNASDSPWHWVRLENILRYGSAAERSFYRSLDTLMRIQERRSAHVEPMTSSMALPALENAKDAATIMSTVMDSMRQGHMRLDQAMKIMRFVETYLKIAERAEYEEALRATKELLETIEKQLPEKAPA